jgi:hypothetical protein
MEYIITLCALMMIGYYPSKLINHYINKQYIMRYNELLQSLLCTRLDECTGYEHGFARLVSPVRRGLARKLMIIVSVIILPIYLYCLLLRTLGAYNPLFFTAQEGLLVFTRVGVYFIPWNGTDPISAFSGDVLCHRKGLFSLCHITLDQSTFIFYGCVDSSAYISYDK